MRIALASSLTLVLMLGACESDGGSEDGANETGGSQADEVTLIVDADPEAICGEFGGSIQIATRRVDCWDPSLPCTVAQDPPWVTGTTDDCSTLAPGEQRWEVTVSQTGRWETRIEAGGQFACFGVEADGRTNVDKAALAEGAELMLPATAMTACDDP